MCVVLITRLLRLVGRWARTPVNHTSWLALVTPTDRPKSVRNRCLIELFLWRCLCCLLPFWHFCWCRGFCHRTGSDLLLFVFVCILMIYLKLKKHILLQNVYFIVFIGHLNIPWIGKQILGLLHWLILKLQPRPPLCLDHTFTFYDQVLTAFWNLLERVVNLVLFADSAQVNFLLGSH